MCEDMLKESECIDDGGCVIFEDECLKRGVKITLIEECVNLVVDGFISEL